MLKIDKEDLSIHLTRGDSVSLDVEVTDVDGNQYTFTGAETIVFKVSKAKDPNDVLINVEKVAEKGATFVRIVLSEIETKIGKSSGKPIDYWYEISMYNRDERTTHTIIGYDDDGAKVFRVYPEIGDVNQVTA